MPGLQQIFIQLQAPEFNSYNMEDIHSRKKCTEWGVCCVIYVDKILFYFVALNKSQTERFSKECKNRSVEGR